MSNEKINVLFMRDDSNVRRYRVSPIWLKLALYGLILLCAMALGGFYAGYTYWSANKELVEERRELQRNLRETSLRLERLENVEKILQSNDPEELQSLFGSMSIEKGKKERPIVDLGTLFSRVDLGDVSVENLGVKESGNGRLRVSFDLNNAGGDKTLTGQVELALVSREGADIPVVVKKDDLSFQIQRYKKIVTTFLLPGGMDVKDLFGLKVVIHTPAGKTIFRDTFQLSRVMS